MNLILLTLLPLTACTTMLYQSMSLKNDTAKHVYILQNIDKNGQKLSHGTGFVVIDPYTSEKRMISAAHVCQSGLAGETGYMTASNKWSKPEKIKVLAIDPRTDTCLLQLPTGVTSGLKIVDQIELDEVVFTVGYPVHSVLSTQYGIALTLSESWFRALWIPVDECKNEPKLHISPDYSYCYIRQPAIHTTIPSSFGISGGPILNSSYEVVGIAVIVNHNISWLSGTPAADLLIFLKSLK